MQRYRRQTRRWFPPCKPIVCDALLQNLPSYLALNGGIRSPCLTYNRHAPIYTQIESYQKTNAARHSTRNKKKCQSNIITERNVNLLGTKNEAASESTEKKQASKEKLQPVVVATKP